MPLKKKPKMLSNHSQKAVSIGKVTNAKAMGRGNDFSHPVKTRKGA